MGFKSFRQGLATGLDACGGIYGIIRRPFALGVSSFASKRAVCIPSNTEGSFGILLGVKHTCINLVIIIHTTCRSYICTSNRKLFMAD